MRKVVRYLWIGVLAAALYVGWVFLSRRAGNPPEKAAAPETASTSVPDMTLKIAQFYSSPSVVAAGDKALLCYGVENAKSVRVEPPVDGVWPSRNRCVEVAPARTTSYKLIAEGADGRSETASTEVQVTANAAQLAELPRIISFNAGPAKQTAAEKAAGGPVVYSVCYQVANAVEVSFDPPVLPPTSAPNGCMYQKPEKTTTYTITARDARGRKATRQLTIKVP